MSHLATSRGQPPSLQGPSTSNRTNLSLNGNAPFRRNTKLHSAKKELNEIQKLELENQKMEERLQAFRENLSRQKAKRLSVSGGNGSSLWSAGDMSRGSLKSYATDVLQKKNDVLKQTRRYTGIGKEADEGTKYIKEALLERSSILNPTKKDVMSVVEANPLTEPVPPPMPPKTSAPPMRMWRIPTPVMQNTEPSAASSTTTSDSISSTLRKPQQRRHYIDSNPSTTTLEKHVHFTEDVDLPRHASMSINILQEQVDISDGVGTSTETQENGLLEGMYDETASRASFLEALNEWRNASKKDVTQKVMSQTEISSNKDQHSSTNTNEGTSTESAGLKSRSQIKKETERQIQLASEKLSQDDSLSYMDRLLLKRMRVRVEELKSESLTLGSKTQLKEMEDAPTQIETKNEARPEDDDTDNEELEAFLRTRYSAVTFTDPEREHNLHHPVPTLNTSPAEDKGAKLAPQMLGLTIQDVTETEEEEILAALNRGQIVECIPPGKLKVIEPDE